MGVGHLNIGTGIGDAGVYNPNTGIQTAIGLLNQRKAKQDADTKYLAETLATAKPDGLRNDADRSNFYNKYNALKQQAIEAENNPNQRDRTMAIANVRQGMMDLNGYVDQSKKQAVNEQAFAKTYMANPTVFSDDAINSHRASSQLAVDNPGLVKDYTTLARQVDGQQIEQQQAAREQQLLKQQMWGTPVVTNTKVGGKNAAFITNSREVPTQALYEDALHRATVDPHFDRFLQQSYPGVYQQATDPVSARALAVKNYIDSRPEVAEHSAPQEKVGLQPDNFYAHEMWKLAHGIGTAANGQPTPAQTLITGMQQGVPGSAEKMIGLAPQGQYGQLKTSGGIPYGTKPTVGIDPQTHEHIFTFPEQIDQKAVEYNKGLQDRWAKENPGTPYDPSISGFKPKETVVQPTKQYRLNPQSPDYVAKAAQMAAEQKIDLSRLNQIEAKKGGHGQIPQVQGQAKPTKINPQALQGWNQ